MTRHSYQPSRASDRRRRLWSDNLVLVPASQLPFKEQWDRIAQGLPAGEALLVVPSDETPFKQVARALVPHLRAHGHHVTAVPAHIEAEH